MSRKLKVRGSPETLTGTAAHRSIVSDGIGSTNGEKVVISFEHFAEDAHGLGEESAEFRELIGHLRKLCSMTWQQVQNSQRHGLGSEKIPKSEIRESIPQCHSDRDSFLSFRYGSGKPMVGVRSGRVLDLIYIDPNFDLYEH